MTAMSAKEARENFSDLLNRSAYRKERIAIVRRGKSVAAVVPIEDLELLEKIEDRLDYEAAVKALEEPGENVTLKDLKRSLGL